MELKRNPAARSGQILWTPRKYDNSDVSWNQYAGIIEHVSLVFVQKSKFALG